MIIREGMNVEVSYPSKVADVVREILVDESKIDREKEHFWTIGVDSHQKIKFIDLVSLGAVNQALVMQREAFRLAVLEGCDSVIFAHNHPSGSSKPSEQDYALSRAFTQAGQILGIKVLDHVIVGTDFYSFKGMNKLEETVLLKDQLNNIQSDIIQLKARVKDLCRAKKRASKINQDTTKSEGKK